LKIEINVENSAKMTWKRFKYEKTFFDMEITLVISEIEIFKC
jgi:hypothetical protein